MTWKNVVTTKITTSTSTEISHSVESRKLSTSRCGETVTNGCSSAPASVKALATGPSTGPGALAGPPCARTSR